jgi:hypothetical protein
VTASAFFKGCFEGSKFEMRRATTPCTAFSNPTIVLIATITWVGEEVRVAASTIDRVELTSVSRPSSQLTVIIVRSRVEEVVVLIGVPERPIE